MSRIRPLNTLLLIAAVIGGVLTYRESQTHRQLLAEQTRLEQKVGSLPIEDPSKMYVRALDTGEPLHFAWRVYVPAGIASKWRTGSVGRSASGFLSASKKPCEFLARVRLRENDGGSLEAFIKQANGSSFGTVGGRQLADLLRGRSDEIQVEQLGADQLVVVEPDEVAVLLRLTLSDQLKREAEEKLPKHSGELFPTGFLSYRVGSDKAFRKAKADQPSAEQ